MRNSVKRVKKWQYQITVRNNSQLSWHFQHLWSAPFHLRRCRTCVRNCRNVQKSSPVTPEGGRARRYGTLAKCLGKGGLFRAIQSGKNCPKMFRKSSSHSLNHRPSVFPLGIIQFNAGKKEKQYEFQKTFDTHYFLSIRAMYCTLVSVKLYKLNFSDKQISCYLRDREQRLSSTENIQFGEIHIWGFHKHAFWVPA